MVVELLVGILLGIGVGATGMWIREKQDYIRYVREQYRRSDEAILKAVQPSVLERSLDEVSEFIERFPQYGGRFPELNQADITVDAKETEDIDMANLCFADWKARKVRIIDAKPEEKP